MEFLIDSMRCFECPKNTIYMVFGTDNLLISFFTGIVNVGLYSNYHMVTGMLFRHGLKAPV